MTLRRALHADLPALVLVGTGVAIALPATPTRWPTPGGARVHRGVYAFASAANNNGSAFAGHHRHLDFFQLTLALAMLLGRFLPIVLVLALAGSLARQRHGPGRPRAPCPPTRRCSSALLVGVIVLVTGLTFFPALALGPIAEALS